MAIAKKGIVSSLIASTRDLLPVLAVIVFFQLVVIGQPIPDLMGLIQGLVFVIIGLTLFVHGLETGLFPIGESMAYALADKGSVFWLILFAFCLGFATTIAEPALIAVAGEASAVAAAEGRIDDTQQAMAAWALGLRIAVALAVGSAIVLGVIRILMGWPLHYLIIGGYGLVVLMTGFAPEEIIGIAYDAGGVTTSTITVPLVTALGVGLSMAIKGRNPAVDGFGLIAFASLTPMMFVMVYGVLA